MNAVWKSREKILKPKNDSPILSSHLSKYKYHYLPLQPSSSNIQTKHSILSLLSQRPPTNILYHTLHHGFSKTFFWVWPFSSFQLRLLLCGRLSSEVYTSSFSVFSFLSWPFPSIMCIQYHYFHAGSACPRTPCLKR